MRSIFWPPSKVSDCACRECDLQAIKSRVVPVNMDSTLRPRCTWFQAEPLRFDHSHEYASLQETFKRLAVLLQVMVRVLVPSDKATDYAEIGLQDVMSTVCLLTWTLSAICITVWSFSAGSRRQGSCRTGSDGFVLKRHSGVVVLVAQSWHFQQLWAWHCLSIGACRQEDSNRTQGLCSWQAWQGTTLKLANACIYQHALRRLFTAQANVYVMYRRTYRTSSSGSHTKTHLIHLQPSLSLPL